MVYPAEISDDKARRRRELKTVIRIYLALCGAGGLTISAYTFVLHAHEVLGLESNRSLCNMVRLPDGGLHFDRGWPCLLDFDYLALMWVHGPIYVLVFAGAFGLLLLGFMTIWRNLLGALRRFVGSAPANAPVVATPKVRAVASYFLAVTCLAALGERYYGPILFPWIAFFRGFTWPFLVSPAVIYVLAVAWRRRRRRPAS